ncbi:hypothetical protein K4L44_02750 [Halosquirtibacter laminarini]|uniref:Uncharacterized protein n=1 Tax=Halosquirtibacter laminarini TaxID=3374600 RepID=A0AC61NGP3_9BACT|nr:hypothetical protein K4L44_02750 [Prolixibacteraceae bacterium]
MIKLKINRVFFVAFLLQLSFVFTTQGQTTGAKDEAISYFNKEAYNKAFPLFVQLHDLYGSDPLMNYYYGVTKVKIKRFDQDIITSLRQSLQSKETPSNALFYLGQAYHAFGQYEKALDSYARFQDSSKRKEQKKLQVKEYKEMAYEKNNPFSLDVGRSRVARIKEEKHQKELETVNNSALPNKSVSDIEDEKSSSKSIDLSTYEIQFNINGLLTYHRVDDFKENASKSLFLKGLELQVKRLGLSEKIEELRNVFKSIETNEDKYSKSEVEEKRNGLTNQIIKLEKELYPLLKQEQQRFAQSKMVEQTYWKDYSQDDQKKYAIALSKKYNTKQVFIEDKLVVPTPKEDKKSVDTNNTNVEQPNVVPAIAIQKAATTPESTKSNIKTNSQEKAAVVESNAAVVKQEPASSATLVPSNSRVDDSKMKSSKEEAVTPKPNTPKTIEVTTVEKKKEVAAIIPAQTTKNVQETKAAIPNEKVEEKVVTKAEETPAIVNDVDVPSVTFDEDMTFDVGTTATTSKAASKALTTTVSENKQAETPKSITTVTDSKSPDAYYAIQIKALKGDLPATIKNQVEDVTKNVPIHFYSKGDTRYYVVGYFTSLKDAAIAKKALRAGGFSDAFTVALDKKGNRISFDAAKKIIG